MKITIKGSPKEAVELAKVLVSAENKEKNADLPPLLTELAERNSIVKNGKVKPIERLFSDLKPNFQAALEKFCGDKKINELAEAIRNAGEENAPQTEAAEQNHEIRYFNTTPDNLEKTAQDISERRSMIESMRS